MPIGISEKVSGANLVFGLDWSPKKNKCGVEISTLQGNQYGQASPEFEGCISFAGYISTKIENGIAIYQLSSGKWSIVGFSGGVLAPDSDIIVDEDFILEAISEMSNLVSDSIYLMGDGDIDLQYEQIDYSDIKNCNIVVVRKKFDTKKVVIFAIVLMLIGGYFGNKHYQKLQAEEIARVAVIDAEIARIAEEKRVEESIFNYIYSFAPAIYSSAVNEVERTVPAIAANWIFSSFEFTHMEGYYTRTEFGTLQDIYMYSSKNNLNIREIRDDGNAVALSFNIKLQKKFPYSDSEILLSSKDTWVRTVTMMQELSSKGFLAVFSKTPPVWASSLPSIPSKYGKVFFKVSGDISLLENLLKDVNIFGVVAGKIIFNYTTKSFIAEFAVYSNV